MKFGKKPVLGKVEKVISGDPGEVWAPEEGVGERGMSMGTSGGLCYVSLQGPKGGLAQGKTLWGRPCTSKIHIGVSLRNLKTGGGGLAQRKEVWSPEEGV